MSTCGCGSYGYDMADYDGEDVKLWREGRCAKVKRDYTCCECSQPIPKGSPCCYATGVADGEWFTMRRCPTCSAIAELVADKNQSCPLWGELAETAQASGFNWNALTDPESSGPPQRPHPKESA